MTDQSCSHADLLREIAARLEAIGTDAAADVLARLCVSAEAHADVVEASIAAVEALEASAPIH